MHNFLRAALMWGNPKSKVLDIMAGLTCSFTAVTPEIALQWRTEKHFPRQRRISRANVLRLAREMDAGRFIQGLQIYVCVLPDGTEYVVNGNHTLEAIFECGIPQVLLVTYKKVTDIEEAGAIYSVFDNQQRRTMRDALVAGGINDQIGDVSAFAAALTIVKNDLCQTYQRTVTSSEINALKGLYEEAMIEYEASISGCSRASRKLCRRAPIMAVGLVTIKDQPHKAADFWSTFAHDDGLRSGMPQHSLLRYLRNSGSGAGYDRGAQVRAAVLAWNAYFSNASLTVVKPDQMTNFRILGTEYAKGLRATHEV